MPAPAPITEITAELFDMRWPTRPAIHGWLGVRRTSVKILGLVIEKTKGGFRLARNPAAAATTESQADLERFDDYANQVDNLLRLAQEPPERDAYVRGLMAEGVDPRQAADRIISNRAEALARSAEPSSTENVTWDSGKKAPVAAAEAPPEPADEGAAVTVAPAPEPPSGPSRQALEAVVALGGDEDAARARAALERAPPAELKVPAPEPPKRKRATRPPKLAVVPGPQPIPAPQPKVAKPKPLRQARLPLERPIPARALNPGPIVINLLDRPGGATLAELQQAIGWAKPPHPLFVMTCAQRAGRALKRQGVTYTLVRPGDDR